jgi:phosphatidylserine decarboxylase
MAKSLQEWVEADVQPFRDQSIAWLSQYHFFRDPSRASYSDLSYFFSPADGIIVYQKVVSPDDAILDIKGRPFSLRDAMRMDHYDHPSLVIGIFMTFFDVHINRIPYPGRLSYRLLDPISTFNRPMLYVERALVDDLRIDLESAGYLHDNQRVINRVDSVQLGQEYYILQIADYDVDCITPFELKQNQPCDQGHRFSQVRYGSQVDLIVPLSKKWEFTTTQQVGSHVEAGVDTLIKVERKPRPSETG